MNSLEQEEYFFINNNIRLSKKTGFFVYYQVKPKAQQISEKKEGSVKVDIEIPEPLMEGERVTRAARGRYRELLKQQKQFADMTSYSSTIGHTHEKMLDLSKASNATKEHRMSYGLVAVIALLVVAIGGNAMSAGGFSAQVKTAVETMGKSVGNGETNLPSTDTAKTVKEAVEEIGDTEEEMEQDTQEDIQEDTESVTTKIPVEEY